MKENRLAAGAGPNPQATQNSPATNIAKELRREAAQWHPSEKSPIRQLLAGADEIERLTAAIERLGSSETLTIPFAFGRSAADDELKARIEYARDALAGKTAAQQSEGEATLQSSIRSEALEVLQEVYTACLSGDFYADHDEATRLLGTMRRRSQGKSSPHRTRTEIDR